MYWNLPWFPSRLRRRGQAKWPSHAGPKRQRHWRRLDSRCGFVRNQECSYTELENTIIRPRIRALVGSCRLKSVGSGIILWDLTWLGLSHHQFRSEVQESLWSDRSLPPNWPNFLVRSPAASVWAQRQSKRTSTIPETAAFWDGLTDSRMY